MASTVIILHLLVATLSMVECHSSHGLDTEKYYLEQLNSYLEENVDNFDLDSNVEAGIRWLLESREETALDRHAVKQVERLLALKKLQHKSSCDGSDAALASKVELWIDSENYSRLASLRANTLSSHFRRCTSILLDHFEGARDSLGKSRKESIVAFGSHIDESTDGYLADAKLVDEAAYEAIVIHNEDPQVQHLITSGPKPDAEGRSLVEHLFNQHVWAPCMLYMQETKEFYDVIIEDTNQAITLLNELVYFRPEVLLYDGCKKVLNREDYQSSLDRLYELIASKPLVPAVTEVPEDYTLPPLP